MPVPPVIAIVTSPVKAVARLPWLSRAVTTAPNDTPAVPPAGCVVKTSWLAAPGMMLNALLTALAGPVAVAVRL